MRIAFLVLFLIALTSCASFAYKYFGIQWADSSSQVILLGPSKKDDKPFTICQETGKCVVMEESEFFKLRRDYEEMKVRLQELERRCGKPTDF